MPNYLADHRADTLFVNGSLESLLPEHSVARVIWDALSGLDFSQFDESYRNDEQGRPAIDPRRLAGVWIVALMRGISSSVVVGGLCKTDIEMRWMIGDAPVHKSTLCEFRTAQLKELSHLSTQLLAALARSGMLPGEQLAIDGTVIRAASSCGASCTRGQLKKRIEKLDALVEAKLAEADAEQDTVKGALKRRERLERALGEMGELGVVDDAQRMTITEPQATLKKLKNKQFAPAHNVQVVTDTASGAIVSTEVVEQANDQGQLLWQVNNAREELERVGQMLSGQERGTGPVKSATADSAYHDTLQLVTLEGEIETYVPDGQTTRRPPGVSDAFLSEAFNYDEPTDTMICPQGHPMKRRKMNKGKTAVSYEAEAKTCRACPFKPECCPRTKAGRTVNRPLYQELLDAVAQRVNSERGRRCKMARWVVVEGAFARLVDLMNWRRCRTWGTAGAQAEALWMQITHNLMLLIGRWKPLVLKGATTG
jgi:transposase